MNHESFGAFAGAVIAPTPAPYDPTGKLAGAAVPAEVVEISPVYETEVVDEPVVEIPHVEVDEPKEVVVDEGFETEPAPEVPAEEEAE